MIYFNLFVTRLIFSGLTIFVLFILILLGKQLEQTFNQECKIGLREVKNISLIGGNLFCPPGFVLLGLLSRSMFIVSRLESFSWLASISTRLGWVGL